MGKLINNHTGGGAVAVGDTVFGITITGEVLQGDPVRPNDDLRGGAGNDFIVGGVRNDIIAGGAGDDVLTGGGPPGPGRESSDVFMFSPGSGHDVITDFQGKDVVYVRDYVKHHDQISVHDTSLGAVIDLGTGDTITLVGIQEWQLVETGTGFVLSHLVVS
jgi:Ca2+-binding RTX toxin-like protein